MERSNQEAREGTLQAVAEFNRIVTEHSNRQSANSIPPGPSSIGMNRASTGRIQQELANFMRDPPDGCRVEVVDSNIFHWRATIMGPPETPYEGGQFVLNIIFPIQYPFQAPIVTFSTKIYHCNITNSGHICLNILNKEWSPALTIGKFLISIISLLADPNPDDAADRVTAHLYKHDRKQHDFNARVWTERYARPRAEDNN